MMDYILQEEEELRVEVLAEDRMEVKLLSGSAEMFGSELVLNTTYVSTPRIKRICPIYTWNGCTIRISHTDTNNLPDIATRTAMPMYLSAHISIEKLRKEAEKERKRGPTVMVCGSKCTGKNSLSRILCNYAVRSDRSPLFVDVDTGEGMVSIPGTVGAVVVDKQTPVLDDELLLPDGNALVFNYGDLDQDLNVHHYKLIVSKLAEMVNKMQKAKEKIKYSGIIINTSNWIRKGGYKLLLEIAQMFEVDAILVLENQQLYNDLNIHLNFIKIAFLPKSNGIVESTKDERRQIRENKVRSYFYGDSDKTYEITVPFNKIKLYKIGENSKVDETLATQPTQIPISSHLNGKLFALSMAAKEKHLCSSQVAGFVCVIKANEEKREVVLLSPEPEPLPKNMFILSQLTFRPSNISV